MLEIFQRFGIILAGIKVVNKFGNITVIYGSPRWNRAEMKTS